MATKTSATAVAPAISPVAVPLKEILFLTDFSHVSDATLNYALAFARSYESHLYVAHILEPLYVESPEAALRASELLRKSAEEDMAELLISARLRGVSHDVILEEGPLWGTVERLIQEKGIDLVVLGTHGRTGVKKLLLGSVAEEIYRKTICPVLTVGPMVRGGAEQDVRLKQIVFATDLRPTSERATAYALFLAEQHRARLTLLHVEEYPCARAPIPLLDLKRLEMERMRNLVPAGVRLAVEPQFAVAFGEPADEIIGVARDERADLIILGLRGGARMSGHLPATTAYRVVCNAPCPVLTVHS
jgi:nucleotide-binding universal stress UspA family protein